MTVWMTSGKDEIESGGSGSMSPVAIAITLDHAGGGLTKGRPHAARHCVAVCNSREVRNAESVVM